MNLLDCVCSLLFKWWLQFTQQYLSRMMLEFDNTSITYLYNEISILWLLFKPLNIHSSCELIQLTISVRSLFLFSFISKHVHRPYQPTDWQVYIDYVVNLFTVSYFVKIFTKICKGALREELVWEEMNCSHLWWKEPLQTWPNFRTS